MSLLSFLIRRNELPRKHERYRFRPRLEVLEGRALPSTLVVHNPNEAGLGSLRQTIHDAASGDKIIFDHALAGETITLTSELLITRSLQIQGFDFGRVDGSPVVINGNGASRVFDIFVSTADVTLFGLIITGGFAGTAIGDNGGGILTSGTLTVSHCTLSGNAGNYGGGI